MLEKIIKIENNTGIPKYQQIVNAINTAVGNKTLKLGDHLPSINDLCKSFPISKETAISAYNELKSMGVIVSSPRKGFYISTPSSKPKHKVFLFLDEFSQFKEVLYNGLKEGLANKGTLEVYFHHFNFKVFETIIRESISKYTSFVIMPIPNKKTDSILQLIPENKLYILDVGLIPYGKKYPSVCQNFEKDIISGLKSGTDLLAKYNKLILVNPNVIQRQDLTTIGFEKFCNESKIEYELIPDTKDRIIQKGEAYIVIIDLDLVPLIQQANALNYELGKDIGILSYNDTPLKAIVAKGITVISTDFKGMGLTMAELIIHKKKDKIENPCYLLRRNSL